MRFGLLFLTEVVTDDAADASGAPPSRPRAERLWEAIDQVRLAEELGFDRVWCIERAVGGAPAAAPEMWLAALAQHTARMRIGHGARLLPFAYANPIRVAESAAVLDVVCEGRLDFAAGRPSSSPRGGSERSACADDGDGPGPDCDEALRVLTGMWTRDAFAWDSERFRMPARNVLPKPLQQPHPPLWWYGGSRGAAVQAGERGLGFLHMRPGEGPAGSSIDDAAKAYREAVARAEPIGAAVNAQFACAVPLPGDERSDDALRRLDERARAGVDTVLLHVEPEKATAAEIGDALHRFGREVMPRFAG